MKSALLVLDVQRGLFDKEPQPYEAAAVVERINSLTARARAAGNPVVFVQHERARGFLAHDSESWQLVAGLQVEPGDTILRKTTHDAFLRTNLKDLLAQWGVAQVVICGYASEFCIDTTTRSAAALGLPVVVVEDAHTTHDKAHASAAQIREHHNITLPNLTSFGPKIVALAAAAVAFDAI